MIKLLQFDLNFLLLLKLLKVKVKDKRANCDININGVVEVLATQN